MRAVALGTLVAVAVLGGCSEDGAPSAAVQRYCELVVPQQAVVTLRRVAAGELETFGDLDLRKADDYQAKHCE